MNILYVSAPGGGLETNVRLLAPALVQAGHRVSLLYFSFHVPPNSHLRSGQPFPTFFADIGNLHYYVHRLTPTRWGLSSYLRLYEIALAVGRTVRGIHCNTPLDLIELPEIPLPLQKLPAPFVMRLHSAAWMCRVLYCEPALAADGWQQRLEGETLRRAHGISSPSRFVANYVRNACSVDKHIEIIPYPVDTVCFHPAPELLRTKRVLFVGRVEARKGADVLLHAVPHVLLKHPDAEFVFAGRVDEELRALVNAAPPQVKFLGVVPHEELPALYQSAAVVVVPSQWDNSPNVIYEAMACGAPVVATRVGGIPELVEEGVTGMLVPPCDENALADAITTLLDDSLLRERMGQRGRERAVAEFALEKILERTLSLYESVLDA